MWMLTHFQMSFPFPLQCIFHIRLCVFGLVPFYCWCYPYFTHTPLVVCVKMNGLSLWAQAHDHCLHPIHYGVLMLLALRGMTWHISIFDMMPLPRVHPLTKNLLCVVPHQHLLTDINIRDQKYGRKILRGWFFNEIVFRD